MNLNEKHIEVLNRLTDDKFFTITSKNVFEVRNDNDVLYYLGHNFI